MRRGTVVLADLDPVRGHEQSGRRPCVVVSDTDVAEHQRFALAVIVPLTSTPLSGPLYPALDPNPRAGVSVRSYVLTDQVRVLDKSRIRGTAKVPLGPAEMGRINEALRFLLGMNQLTYWQQRAGVAFLSA